MMPTQKNGLYCYLGYIEFHSCRRDRIHCDLLYRCLSRRNHRRSKSHNRCYQSTFQNQSVPVKKFYSLNTIQALRLRQSVYLLFGDFRQPKQLFYLNCTTSLQVWRDLSRALIQNLYNRKVLPCCAEQALMSAGWDIQWRGTLKNSKLASA